MLDSVTLVLTIIVVLMVAYILYLVIFLFKLTRELYESVISEIDFLKDTLSERDIIDTMDKPIRKENPYMNPATGLYDYAYYKRNIRKG